MQMFFKTNWLKYIYIELFKNKILSQYSMLNIHLILTINFKNVKFQIFIFKHRKRCLRLIIIKPIQKNIFRKNIKFCFCYSSYDDCRYNN